LRERAVLPAKAEPWLRLIIEFTVSTCHLCVYPHRFRESLVASIRFIRRRHRPDGGTPDWLRRPISAGLINR